MQVLERQSSKLKLVLIGDSHWSQAGTWTPMLTGDALAIGNPLPVSRFSCISYSCAFLIMARSQN